MTQELSIIQANRFGYGIRLDEQAPQIDLRSQLQAPWFGEAQTEPDLATRMARILAFNELRRSQDRDSEAYVRLRREMNNQISADLRDLFMRPTFNPNGFAERLFAFWTDHFTVSPNALVERYLLSNYFETAIRPHIAGRFADMLSAVVQHPSMIKYLDQNVSIGPNSTNGQRQNRGLNENLAREVLELHTLGVGGPYTQNDVREFAELLTGLSIGREGTVFLAIKAEPGAEQILGQSYGGGRAKLSAITNFLEDLAMKPATARHLARKLAVHFIGPDHPQDLIEEMVAEYLANDGVLIAMYQALLAHPAAGAPLGQKIRPPFEYMVACFRAIGVTEQSFRALPQRDFRKSLLDGMVNMGQTPFRPPGPDGWPEEPENWISPPLLAARIQWASNLARDHGNQLDPRALLTQIVGDNPPGALSFAISAAEAKWEGVALMLISPAMMRR